MATEVPVKRELNQNDTWAFDQWTGVHNDTCAYQNSLLVGSAPMKYYVSEYNSPQTDPFATYSVVGNMKQYNVRNDFERPIPSRLNPIYQSYVIPYQTTPFLANMAENRTHTNTSSELRFGSEIRPQKSSVNNSEVDYNRWAPNVSAQTVQNAGQFQSGATMQPSISRNGEFDPKSQNNVLFANGAFPRAGISSRNELHNAATVMKC